LKDLEKLSEPFKALIGNAGLNYQLLDLLPIPIQIFSPDGTCMFVNRALVEINADAIKNVVGNYNYNNDPICREILGQDVYDKVSRGEAVSFPDFPVPIQSAVDRGFLDEKPFETATMDLFFLPLWDGEVFTCTIMFYTVKNMYHGRADIAKAKEYIDKHWLADFDLDKVAQSANLSRRHFQRIFKENTNLTPVEYYQKVKIERLQEKLLDGNLSIEQAFAACGVDYRGKYHKYFREKVKMSPSEYRKANRIK
jgi:AraC-like DNA-binding protein